MAVRPWVTPDEVKDYSEQKNVRSRSDEKLKIDISRAEQYVINYTRNRFDDDTKYPEIPESVKTAVVLLAESYAADAVGLGAGMGSFKSETFDEYSYTAADTAYKIGNLNLGSLLDEFIETIAKNSVTMKMRKL